MGQAGCEQTGKIFEASGVPLGGGITGLIYGVKQRLADEVRTGHVDPLAHRLKDAFERLPKLIEATLLSAEEIIGWDEYGDYAPGTSNPIWYDLGPVYRVEGDEPAAKLNDLVLKREGWLKGEFAAAATKFSYDGTLMNTLGCGHPTPKPDDRAELALWFQSLTVCRDIGNVSTLYHLDSLKDIYEAGITGLQTYGTETLGLTTLPALLGLFSWDEYQTGDGLVDYQTSMATCFKGLDQPNSAVSQCFTYTNLNHMATTGAAMESLETMAGWFAQAPVLDDNDKRILSRSAGSARSPPTSYYD